MSALVTETCEDGTDKSPLLTRHSELRRLLRVTALCRRWLRPTSERRIFNADRSALEVGLILSSEELEEARRSWIRIVQATHYQKEKEVIERGGLLPARSELLKLSPFLDGHGTPASGRSSQARAVIPR